MWIGEMGKAAGISEYTMRYYEKNGLNRVRRDVLMVNVTFAICMRMSSSERFVKDIMKDIKKCPKSNVFKHSNNTHIQLFFMPCISFSIRRIILSFMLSLLCRL